MIEMAGEVFDAHHDNQQLQVDEDVIEQLHKLHPSCVTELDEGEGPVLWILLIPTTEQLMNDFVNEKISEKELLDKTPLDIKYDALYLCSAMVLPEYRRKGLAKKLGLQAIENIRKTNPIKTLFVWTFSKEGDKLAELTSLSTGLKLLQRKSRIK
jgi:GNAT superfamily N-acetyltransferase